MWHVRHLTPNPENHMKATHSIATENRFPNKKILYSMRSFQKKDRSKAKATPRPGFKRRPKR